MTLLKITNNTSPIPSIPNLPHLKILLTILTPLKYNKLRYIRLYQRNRNPIKWWISKMEIYNDWIDWEFLTEVALAIGCALG